MRKLFIYSLVINAMITIVIAFCVVHSFKSDVFELRQDLGQVRLDLSVIHSDFEEMRQDLQEEFHLDTDLSLNIPSLDSGLSAPKGQGLSGIDPENWKGIFGQRIKQRTWGP